MVFFGCCSSAGGASSPPPPHAASAAISSIPASIRHMGAACALLPALSILPMGDAAAACTTHDRWTGQDKLQHATVGAFVGAGAAAYYGTWRAGVAAGTVVGVAKELADGRGAGVCSLQDAVATAAGAALGAALGVHHAGGRTTVTYTWELK